MVAVLLDAGLAQARSSIGEVSTRAAATWVSYGDASIAAAVAETSFAGPRATIARLMFKSLVRTFRGPSKDPRMAFISRPLPRDLPDEQVLAALELALATDPDPAYLVETLPPALMQVSGRSLQVLDRTVRDVTGAFVKTSVMIRDGDVGTWPGYAAMSYPLIAPSAKQQDTRAAIVEADAPDGTDASAGPKPGWAPPPPITRR